MRSFRPGQVRRTRRSDHWGTGPIRDAGVPAYGCDPRRMRVSLASLKIQSRNILTFAVAHHLQCGRLAEVRSVHARRRFLDSSPPAAGHSPATTEECTRLRRLKRFGLMIIADRPTCASSHRVSPDKFHSEQSMGTRS